MIVNPLPGPVAVPKLLRAYLALGAKVCGPPAIDREFRTIDALTWLDLASLRLSALRGGGRFNLAAAHATPPVDVPCIGSAYTDRTPG